MKRHMPALVLAAALVATPGLVFAQGGSSDTPRPPGSDPSAAVSRSVGQPSAPPGSTGNPTGRAIDRTPTPGSSVSGNPANPGQRSASDPAAPTTRSGAPAAGAPSAPGSRTN